MRKPRPNPCALMRMPQAQIDTLARWLTVDNLTYDQARVRLEKEFSVKTKNTQLCCFYQSYCSRNLARPVAVAGGAPETLLEVVLDFTQPKFVRLKIISANP